MEADGRSGRFGGNVVTRFPPEPNGYLHIGHAKSMCLNFGLAQEYGGRCHMRFDDTNPAKEEEEFVDGIMEDVRWLGWDWGEHLYFASDHFDKLYDFAIDLIKKGQAYVDDLDQEQIRQYRGTSHRAGCREPLQEPLRRGKPGPLPRNEERRDRRRRTSPARKDRHGVGQYQHA